MKNFYNFDYKSRKNEFAQFYSHIHGVVSNFDAEALKIVDAVAKVTEHLPLLEELKVRNLKQPLTQEQKSLISKIDKGVSAFSGFISTKLRQDNLSDPEKTDFYQFINVSLKGYTGKNTYRRMSTINKMLQSIAADSSYSDLLENDECSEIVAKLQETYEAFDVIYQKRRKATAEKLKSKVLSTKRKMYFVIRELLATIDINAVANPDLNYKPLIDELNAEISRFNAGSKPIPRKTEVNENDESLAAS